MSFTKEQFKDHWQFHDFVSKNLDKKGEILDFLEYIFNEIEEPRNINFLHPYRVKYRKTIRFDNHGISDGKDENWDKDFYSEERLKKSNGQKIF